MDTDRHRPSAVIGGGFRSLTPAARLLVINQFGVNLGFYMVLPFLAGYLREDLGLAAVLVGLLLGLRTLSQQGLFLLGGTAADWLGPRRMIIAGCGLRVVGFGLFAVGTTVPAVVAGTVLSGVAGALFNPAVRAFLVHESPGRRAEAFAVFNVAGNTGSLVGPLLGAGLLAVDFRLVSLVACVVFAALTVAQVLVLPHREVQVPDGGVLRTWREVAGNRRFLAFAVAGSAYLALFNQLYLALPLEAHRVTGLAEAVGAVFVVSTVVGIAMQMRVVAWARRRCSAGQALAAGLALIGASFAPVAISAPLTAPGAGLPDLVAAAPVLAGTVLLSVGTALASPFLMELLPVVGSERLVGTYYGWFYLISAVAAASLGAVVGGLLDLTAPTLRWTPFAVLTAVGLAGGAAIAMMQRRGHLHSRNVLDERRLG